MQTSHLSMLVRYCVTATVASMTEMEALERHYVENPMDGSATELDEIYFLATGTELGIPMTIATLLAMKIRAISGGEK